MATFIGTKMRMTQLFKGERAIGVTPIRLRTDADVTPLKEGIRVAVAGISKGKGFQGVVKRHGFHGGPKTHGQKNRHRAPGSIGNTTPQRVIPGRKMAGHMGAVRVTTKNLRIAELKAEERIVFLEGAVPGNGGRDVELIVPEA